MVSLLRSAVFAEVVPRPWRAVRLVEGKQDSSVTNVKTQKAAPPVKVASLDQLDALVGRYVMDDSPRVYWEHKHSQWRFDSLGDALNALDDPFFNALVPEAQRENLAVTEVREFPPYSGDLGEAIRVVEQLGAERKPLTLCPAVQKWVASFGESERVEAPSPAVAICMAALRMRGLEVELARDLADQSLRMYGQSAA